MSKKKYDKLSVEAALRMVGLAVESLIRAGRPGLSARKARMQANRIQIALMRALFPELEGDFDEIDGTASAPPASSESDQASSE